MSIDDRSVVSKQMQVQDNLQLLVPTFNQTTRTRSPVPSRNSGATSAPNFGTSTVTVEGFCSSDFCNPCVFYDNDFTGMLAPPLPFVCVEYEWYRTLEASVLPEISSLLPLMTSQQLRWFQERPLAARTREKTMSESLSVADRTALRSTVIHPSPLGTSRNCWVRVFEENLQSPERGGCRVWGHTFTSRLLVLWFQETWCQGLNLWNSRGTTMWNSV